MRTLTLHTRTRSQCADQRFARADASRGGVPASPRPLWVTSPFPVWPTALRRGFLRRRPGAQRPPLRSSCLGPAPPANDVLQLSVQARLPAPSWPGRADGARSIPPPAPQRGTHLRPSRPARRRRRLRGGGGQLALRPLGAGRDGPGAPPGPRDRRPGEGTAAATSGGRAGPAGELGYFVAAPSTQASLPPLNETPLLRDVQPLHLIKEIALQC